MCCHGDAGYGRMKGGVLGRYEILGTLTRPSHLAGAACGAHTATGPPCGAVSEACVHNTEAVARSVKRRHVVSAWRLGSDLRRI